MPNNELNTTSFFKRLSKFIREGFQLGLFLGFVGFFLTFLSNRIVIDFAHPHTYSVVSETPENKVGLVLGTSKFAYKGGINPYFRYRMESAAKLYQSGKLKHLIVSGDNHKDGYNEPQQMKEYLIELGVKPSDITLDYAGFRTFDSVIRLKEIFGQNKVTIISQQFHNERAIFLARKNNIEAIGYNATSPYASYRMRLREYLAKCKAILDIYVLKTTPKFLGEKIEIPL